MAGSDGPAPANNPAPSTPADEFLTYCEAEFERRLNSGDGFDEAAYRKAMHMVHERLVGLEDAGRS